MEHNPIQLPDPGLRMLRLSEVKYRVGLSRSAIYEKIKQGEFPAPVRIGPRAVAWISVEITNWIDARIAATRGSAMLRSA